jgi:levansucrase
LGFEASAEDKASAPEHMVSRWQQSSIRLLDLARLPAAPLIEAADVSPVLPMLDIWDHWPLQAPDGSVAQVAGGELWLSLSAPRMANPNDRHNVARTRLLWRTDSRWQDCGPLLPDGLNPGSREWSGAARYDAETGGVTIWLTAAGRRDEAGHGFEQRLFHVTGRLDLAGALPGIVDWSPVSETVVNDGRFYALVRDEPVADRRIIGFRDPYWLRDPADGRGWLLFTASQAGSGNVESGVVGLAEEVSEGHYELRAPLISGDGLVNEMERPHMVMRDGLYYLFWSTQASQFAPGGRSGPTGLYGMVAPRFLGPYEPLNETGLVLANPSEEPCQAYCWQVLDSLEVTSFIDHWGLKGRDPSTDPALNRAQFGGTFAPVLKLALEGNRTRLIGLAR